MMENKKLYQAGFTLYELLMVVTILAIICSLAFSKYGMVQRSSAEKVSLSNQHMIARAVETWLGFNDAASLNRLDALIDRGTPNGSAGTFNFGMNNINTAGGIYRGPKPFDDGKVMQNRGIDDGLAAVLAVYYLSDTDVAALRQLDIRYAMRSVTTPPSGSDYGTGEDGVRILTPDELDPELVACYATELVPGVACAAIDPRFETGALIYQSAGLDLQITQSGQNVADGSVLDVLQAVGGKLLAFGLGSHTAMVGKIGGGLETAPYCEVLKKYYYRQYILLIQITTTGNTNKAEFVGVLDPMGNTMQMARQQIK